MGSPVVIYFTIKTALAWNTVYSIKRTDWQAHKSDIKRVQALADISRSALRRHSNETRAPIANPPNSTQLEGTPYPNIPPSCIRVRAVVWECGEGQTDTDTQTAVASIHFALATTKAKCNEAVFVVGSWSRELQRMRKISTKCQRQYERRWRDLIDRKLVTSSQLLPTTCSACWIISSR